MNFSLDKLLLAVVPYLYFVSVCYYWGYWGTLDVDAFSYYALSDIVKSIISPISSTLASILITLMALVAVEIIQAKSKEWSGKKTVVITLISVPVILYFITFSTTKFITPHPDVDPKNGFPMRIAGVILYGYLAGVSIRSIKEWLNLPIINNNFIVFFCIAYPLVIVPGRAYVSGRDRALRIMQNKEFEYVATYPITGHQPWFYKFLGKAGDYYLLTTMNNKKVIITPTSKMSPLITSQYSVLDSISVHRFRMQAKRMIESK